MSLFDLKTEMKDLEQSNMGISKLSYMQVPPKRDISKDNFSNGVQTTAFEMSGTQWWIPSKSYQRYRCKLTQTNDAVLTKAHGVAPDMNFMSKLFQSMDFKIGGKMVSRISDNVPQIDTLQQRLRTSKATFDSFGNSINFMSPKFEDRLNAVSSDGVEYDYVEAGRLAMGFTIANTIGVAAATGIITVAAGAGAGALPDLTTVFKLGDEIEITTAAGIRHRGTVNALTDATHMVLDHFLAADVAAAVHDFKRIRKVPARRVKHFEIMYQPPLSIFNIDTALPCGQYELSMNPVQKDAVNLAAVEALIALPLGYKFEIESLQTYICVVEGVRVDNLSYMIDLTNTACQSFPKPNPGYGALQFDVSPSTYALTVAVQDTRSNDARISSTRFKSYEEVAASQLVSNNGLTEVSRTVNRLAVQYDGSSFPNPDADPLFGVNVDLTAQRYLETQLNSGMISNPGGCESLKDWADRGPYYHFLTPKDGSSRSTRATVSIGFDAAVNTTNMKVLLFDHSRQVALVKIEQSRVVSCELQNE